MSNIYSLDQLKRDMDREFAPLILDLDNDKLTLRNLMRINEKEREEVLGALKVVEKSSGKEEGDLEVAEITALSQAVGVILKNIVAEGKGDKLVAFLDGDLMMAMKIMDLWTEATQPGEAPNSPA
jgi:hypothetical protein